MIAKTTIALSAALVLGSVSGAFAFNNIGEITHPEDTAVQSQIRHTARQSFAAAPRQQRVQVPVPAQQNWIERPTANISSY